MEDGSEVPSPGLRGARVEGPWVGLIVVGFWALELRA